MGGRESESERERGNDNAMAEWSETGGNRTDQATEKQKKAEAKKVKKVKKENKTKH